MSVNSLVIKNATHTAYIFETPIGDTGYVVLPPTVTPLVADAWCGKLLRACAEEFEAQQEPLGDKTYPKAEFITVSKAVEFMPIELYRIVKARYPADHIVHVIQDTYFAFVVETGDVFEMPLMYCEKPITNYTVYGGNCSAMSVANKPQSIRVTNAITCGAIPLTITKRFEFSEESIAGLTNLSKWQAPCDPGQSIQARTDPLPLKITLAWTCTDCDKKQLTPACFVKTLTDEAVCYNCTQQSGELKFEYFPQGR